MLPNSGLLKICKSFKSFTPFNKMSSLCCAIATQRLTALGHAIAAQITAFLLSAMPMHPKQNLAAANRYGAPLFLRKSNQRFSLPFLCSAIRDGAVLCHRSATLRFSFALPVCASQCHCTAVHLIAFAKHRPASPCIALHRRCRAKRCLCASSQITAMPLQCKSLLRCAKPSHGQSNSAFPLPSCASHRLRESGPCHALALRPSPHRRCK